jgi:hypothetical protein
MRCGRRLPAAGPSTTAGAHVTGVREPHPLQAGQGAWVACSRQPRMYTGVPGVGTSVWKNAAMCVGIRTQP